MSKKVDLKWVETVSENGNVSYVSNIKGTLKRLSKTRIDPKTKVEGPFSYQNASGKTIEHGLATVVFTDNSGNSHTIENVVVFQKSIDQGMEVGETYLGQISRSFNEDGSARLPWTTLSSLPTGVTLTDNMFGELEFESEKLDA
jgi:hypothetical protein